MPKAKSAPNHVQPLANRLVITNRPEKLEKQDLQVVGGILIPDSAATGKVGIEPYYLADVLAAGPECKTVKKGDVVIVPRGLDWKVQIDGVLLAVMVRENEVHGVLK